MFKILGAAVAGGLVMGLLGGHQVTKWYYKEKIAAGHIVLLQKAQKAASNAAEKDTKQVQKDVLDEEYFERMARAARDNLGVRECLDAAESKRVWDAVRPR